MNIQPEYLTLDKLLAKRLFRIPHYQRAYSWTRKERSDMFEDISKLKGKPDNSHFMATIVGLHRETKIIVIDQYDIIEIVDGQQRLTTLVLLLKAIEQELASSLTDEDRSARTSEARFEQDLQELLVKPDELSLILLQTNHDRSQYFANFLRYGTAPTDIAEAETLADRELLHAIRQCKSFVNKWNNPIELLGIIKNQLQFIFHQTDDEAAVYTVFEVLNNRGLHVSWMDRLKSMLMAVVFENDQGNSSEHIDELHRIWGEIYETIGLREGIDTEALRFGATLRSPSEVSKPFGEGKAVETLMKEVGTSTANAVRVSTWLLEVTKAIDRFHKYTEPSRQAVTKISQARLLALAILLRNFPCEEERKILNQWERTTFRTFGLCRKDARTGVGDYVNLAWKILNRKCLDRSILWRIKRIGDKYDIDEAFTQYPDCYESWQEELRYLLYRYEEYLAVQQGQTFNNQQWNGIWEKSTSDSIEHILPQSKGSQEPTAAGFVHRLGNLLLLPPRLNSELSDKEPIDKACRYQQTGLLIAAEVAQTIQGKGEWERSQIEEREQKIREWIKVVWKRNIHHTDLARMKIEAEMDEIFSLELEEDL